MQYSFAENFWGEKNNGYEVLVGFAKQDIKVTSEVNQFLRDHMLIEESYIKSLQRLVTQMLQYTTFKSSSFAPCWLLLKNLIDKAATLNVQFVHRISECAQQVAAYGELQKEQQRVLLHEHDTPCGDALAALQSAANHLQQTQRTYSARLSEYEKLKREPSKNNSGASIRVVAGKPSVTEAKLRKAESDAKKAKDDYRAAVTRYNNARSDFEKRSETAFAALQKIAEAHLNSLSEALISFGGALEQNSDLYTLSAREFITQMRETAQTSEETPIANGNRSERIDSISTFDSENDAQFSSVYNEVKNGADGEESNASASVTSSGRYGKTSRILAQFVAQRSTGRVRPTSVIFEELDQELKAAPPAVPTHKLSTTQKSGLRSIRKGDKELSKSMFNVSVSVSTPATAEDYEVYAEVENRNEHEYTAVPPPISGDAQQKPTQLVEEQDSIYEAIPLPAGAQKEPDSRRPVPERPEKTGRPLFGLFTRKDKKRSTGSAAGNNMSHAVSTTNISRSGTRTSATDDVFSSQTADSESNFASTSDGDRSRISALIQFDEEANTGIKSDAESGKIRSDLNALNWQTDSSNGRERDRAASISSTAPAGSNGSDSSSDDDDDDRAFRNIQIKIRPANEAVTKVTDDQLLLAAKLIKPGFPPAPSARTRSPSRSDWNLAEESTNARSITFAQFDINFDGDADNANRSAPMKRSQTVDETMSAAAWSVTLDVPIESASDEPRSADPQFETNFFEGSFTESSAELQGFAKAMKQVASDAASVSKDAFEGSGAKSGENQAATVAKVAEQAVSVKFDNNFESSSVDSRTDEIKSSKSHVETEKSDTVSSSNSPAADDSKSQVSVDELVTKTAFKVEVTASPNSTRSTSVASAVAPSSTVAASGSVTKPPAAARGSVLFDFDPLADQSRPNDQQQKQPAAAVAPKVVPPPPAQPPVVASRIESISAQLPAPPVNAPPSRPESAIGAPLPKSILPPPPTRRAQTPDFLSESASRAAVPAASASTEPNRPALPPRPPPKIPTSQTTPSLSSAAFAPPLPTSAVPASSSGSLEMVKIAVGLIEKVNAKLDSSGSVKSASVVGNLMLSFPATFVKTAENAESLPPLSFRLTDVDLKSVRHNTALLNTQSSGTFMFNMEALVAYVRNALSKNPGPFCNIECITFEQPVGESQIPLTLGSTWRCAATETSVSLRYTFTPIVSNGEPTMCAFRTEVNGDVSFMESRPSGQFSTERQTATWRVDGNPPNSLREGSINARFVLQDGPSTPGSVSAAFNIENLSVSGANFQLASPTGYTISMLKRRTQNGTYECEPTVEAC